MYFTSENFCMEELRCPSKGDAINKVEIQNLLCLFCCIFGKGTFLCWWFFKVVLNFNHFNRKANNNFNPTAIFWYI